MSSPEVLSVPLFTLVSTNHNRNFIIFSISVFFTINEQVWLEIFKATHLNSGKN